MALTTVRPQGMGFNTGRRNLIINGAMQVAQRGTSSTTSGYGSLDRYKIQYSGVSVTHSQESLSSSDSPYSEGFRTALKLTNTSTSSATSAYTQVFQIIESQNVAGSGWNYTSTSSSVTFQFWAKSSLAGTYTTFLRTNDGTQYLYSKDFTLVADTWKKITCTVPGNSNLVFNNDNGQGLDLFVVPHYGTDFTTSGHTDDAWIAYSGSDIAGDYAQSWTNTSSATFFITGIQLEVGENASDFEHRSFGEEEQLCKRYYEQHNFDTTTSMYGGAQSSSRGECPFVYDVTKRANPTISVNDRQAFRVNDWKGGDEQCSSFTVNETRTRQARLSFDKSTANLNVGYVIYMNREGAFGTDPILFIDAEL
jgi:hypothetical protein